MVSLERFSLRNWYSVSVWSGPVDQRQVVRFGVFSDLLSVHLFLSGHFKRMLRGCGRVFGGEVPGKQFVDPVNRVLGDAGQNLAKISFRVQTVEFGGADQRVDGGSAYAAGVGPTKKVVLPDSLLCAPKAKRSQSIDNLPSQRYSTISFEPESIQ